MTSSTNSFSYSYYNGDLERNHYNGVKSGLYYTYTGTTIGYLNILRKKYGLIFCYLRDINTPLDYHSVTYFDPRKNREVTKQNNEKFALVSYYYYNEKDNNIEIICMRSSDAQHVKFKTFKKNFKLYGYEIDTDSLDFKREIRMIKLKKILN
jgi:hypothetical protein